MQKSILILLTVVLILSFGGCSRKASLKTDASLNSSQPYSSEADDNSYVTSAEELWGEWRIKYYSENNITYKSYIDDISGSGYFTFYTDGSCVLQFDKQNISVLKYEITSQDGVISFTESNSEKAVPFYFGYGVVENGDGRRLIISKYDVYERKITYYILCQS